MDPIKVSAYNKSYYEKNREKIALRRLNLRHVGKGDFVPLTQEEWDKTKTDQRGKCKRCDETKVLTPFVTKGTTFLGRVVGLCSLCGSKEALSLARAARQRMKDEAAEKESEKFTGAMVA